MHTPLCILILRLRAHFQHVRVIPTYFVFCRWNKVLRPGLHKGPWTEEEDSIVRECVELSGAQKVFKTDWYRFD